MAIIWTNDFFQRFKSLGNHSAIHRVDEAENRALPSYISPIGRHATMAWYLKTSCIRRDEANFSRIGLALTIQGK
jgi:hypothetical protein